MDRMCERIPLPRVEGPQRFERRAILAAVGGVMFGACTAPRAGSLLRRCAPPIAPTHLGPLPRRAYVPPTPIVRKDPFDDVIPRAAWGARPMRDNHDPMAAVTRLTLHHTDALDDLGGLGGRDDGEVMLAIQRFHQETRGWADIGYHFVVGRDGRVYEGRPLEVQGAHAGGGNNIENVGISAIGNFETNLPDARQLDAIERLLAAAVRRWSLPSAALFGHRDLKPTACPGDALHAWFVGWKAARDAV